MIFTFADGPLAGQTWDLHGTVLIIPFGVWILTYAVAGSPRKGDRTLRLRDQERILLL